MKSRAVLVAVVALSTLVLPAVATAGERHASPRFNRAVLTADDTDLAFKGSKRRLTMTATGRGPDWNRREVFNTIGGRRKLGQTSCATWTSQSGDNVQEGLAVRIRRDAGRVRAITLTKNTIFDVHHIINLLTWDTARTGGDVWQAIGQYNMAGVLTSDGELEPFPWRVCLRTSVDTVSFKIWLLGRDSVPGWRNPDHARSAPIPRGFGGRGRPGWYVGHVPDGGRVVYRDLTTR